MTAPGPRDARFWVPGVPGPQGSKRGMVRAGKVVMVESSAKVKPWRQAVAAAVIARRIRVPRKVETHVSFIFRLPRPASHYGTGRNAGKLKATAPLYSVNTPDGDKLCRSTNDGLTDGGAVVDDAQIVTSFYATEYTRDPEGPGAWITLRWEEGQS